MTRSSARRVPKGRPLLDPRRAPYVKAALLRKQLAAERQACSGVDAKKHERTLAHLRDALAKLEGQDE